MRILLAQSAVYVPTHGGENKANRLLLEALAGRGHVCRVLAPAFGVQGAGSEESFREELARRGMRLSGTGPRSFSFQSHGVAVEALRDSSKLPAALAGEIARFAPDRVLVSSEDPGHGLLEAAASAAPEKTVYLAHTMLFFPFGPNSFARSEAMTAAFRKLGGVITVSAYLKDYIRRWGGREAAVVPFPAFGPGPFPRLGRHDRGTVTIINPCAYKGITIFLELARRMPDVAFAAVPSWGTTAADRAALERHGNVRILPPRDDLDALLADTRALLVPSLWAEGFPLVPVEAMLRGIPVLASDSGGLPEAKLGVPFVLPVRPIERYTERFDEKGLPVAVVPEQDVAPWAEALGTLLSDPAGYDRLAAQSRAAAEEYAGRLGAEPFESYLEQLPAEAAPASRPAPSPGPADREELRRRLERLSPEKRALVLARLRRTPAAGSDEVRRREASEERVVSFAQERLWFLDRMDPGSAVYNNFDALRLTGSLDVASLERALDEIRRRHESLRTAFPEVGGQPRCVVAEPAKTALPVRDLGRIPESDRGEEVRRLAREEARRPFDLGRGPLFRASLLRLGPDEHVLMVGMHHIVSDGWSFGVLLGELAPLYAAFSRGLSSPLPELPVQYADFARWQRERLSGRALEELLEDAKARMTPVPEVLELPADRPRPRVRSQDGARERVVWEADLAERLRAFSRQEGVTLFMTLLAGFQVLLHRYTGQADLVVGTPIANRNRSEWEGLIGLFVNTLPIRADASGDPTFRHFLARVRASALRAYADADLPFEKLVAAVRPERDMSHTPIFQVMLAMQNTPRQMPELPGVRVRPLDVDVGLAKFDLTLDLTESEQGLIADLEYSTDLFDRDRIRRLLGHLQTLLREAVAKPDQRLSRLPLLTGAERRELIDERNRTAVPYPSDLPIHRLFERQVERTPEATAAEAGDERITYAGLDAMANRIAGALRREGVGPESVVGLCLDRGIAMVAAILGVLKAGGAYLPLDPEYPARRLAFMLSDSGAHLLLTESSLRDRLPAVEGVRPLLIGDLRSGAEEPRPEVSPETLAYLIYTSGSTGIPKGVLVTHRSVVNLLCAVAAAPGFSAQDLLAAVTTTSFDIAGLELFLPLVTGGRLAILTREQASDGEELARELREREATVLQATPATWRLLLDSGWPGQAALRMLCGGEALPADLAGALAPRGGELWNMYGPTETTIWSSVHRVGGGESGLVPIGRPIANTRMYVLDRAGQPAPSGVPGELHIAGDGLARGYWNRPGASAERFVPDPFGDPGGRLFRTGDLVRYRDDGTLEYLGRLDHQIKLRGFRIELQEIEAHLAQHPAVRESVVVPRVTEHGDKTLVAYLAGAASEGVDSGALRAFLRDRLPDYMVPSSYVWMPELPRNKSGKVDRQALPAPDDSAAGPRPAATLPASPVEEILAGIFADLLGRRVVHREDDFFDLGGHSLLVTQLVARVAETLGVRLPLRRVFEAPTLAGVAAAVAEARTGAAVSLSPIPSTDRAGPIPLSFAQQGLWFLDQLEPGNPFYNVLLPLQVSGPLDVAALEQTLGEIVRRHEALRTVFPAADGHAVQSILPPGPVLLETRDLEGLPGKRRKLEAERCATEVVRRPFDLARGPLLRATLLRLDAQEHLLLLTMHHIVCDGWSIGLLVRELAALYGAFTRGLPSPLAPLPVQYADFAVWQRRALSGEALREKLAYWTRRLSGAPARLDLSIARPRPPVVDHRGESRRFEISGPLSEAIRALSRRERVTLFMTVVAAFQVLLAHYTGEEDIVIGTDVANRNEVELEGMIGHFVNQVVLRTDLSGDPSFLELLRRVREVTLEAYANQEAPFDKVVEAVRPDRTIPHSPLFQVKLVLQAAPVPPEETYPWTPAPLEVHSGMVKFDLLMFLRDAGASLAGTMEYATALFDAAAIDRLVNDFRIVLDRVVSDPGVRLSALRGLLAEEDRERELLKRRELKDASVRKVARARRKTVFAEADVEELP